jgi:hypothetical protein
MIYASILALLLTTSSDALQGSSGGLRGCGISAFARNHPKFSTSVPKFAQSTCECCIGCPKCSGTRLHAMGKTAVEDSDGAPTVTVRFINTVLGKDVVTTVPIGSNLLVVGDKCGVSLPRACRTGSRVYIFISFFIENVAHGLLVCRAVWLMHL